MSNRRVLIIHQNFPGQFGRIAQALLDRGDQVVAIGGPTSRQMNGVPMAKWRQHRGTTPNIFYQAVRPEADLIRGESGYQAAVALKNQGFQPDIIVAHPAWGETVHMRTVFPDVPQLLFGELYYNARGYDSDFDPEFDHVDGRDDIRVHAKNAIQSLAMTTADKIVCPTRFQADTFPRIFQPMIEVVHEGIDSERCAQRPAVVELPNGRTLDGSTPVITFINRRFERLRGFHIFMRALPELLHACPDAQVVLIGEEQGVSYGAELPGGEQWKDRMLAEVGDRLDLDRVHFLGRVTHDRMLDVFSISWGHVYYTYPFVLSWSTLEAMACECLIIGSDTAPVREVVQDGVNGVLNDFFDVEALSRAMIHAVREPEAFTAMRKAARATIIPRYDSRLTGIPTWLKLIDELAIRR
jgi:glycosyltransferase involved in cell wall biosynthesis